jgi:hypothetical protein
MTNVRQQLSHALAVMNDTMWTAAYLVGKNNHKFEYQNRFFLMWGRAFYDVVSNVYYIA